METISWAARQGTAAWDLCTLRAAVIKFMCVCVRACTCECMWALMCETEREGKEEEERSKPVVFFSSSVVTTWQLIPLHSAVMELALFLIISVQIPGSVIHTDLMQLPAIVCICHMLWQTAGHAFLSHYDLCQLKALLKGLVALKSHISTFDCKQKNTQWEPIVSCKKCMTPLCPIVLNTLKGSITM